MLIFFSASGGLLGLFMVFLLPFLFLSARAGPIISTAQGDIEGFFNSTISYNVFRGIPYAEKPRRWNPPEKKKPWKPKVLKAVNFGADCAQLGPAWPTLGNITTSSEDCLFLNVYVPFSSSRTVELKKEKENLLPIMVYFPAGGWLWGAGRDEENNSPPSQVKDVIFVTVNYRVGIFGGAAHELLRKNSPDRGSGHYGMDDQRQALRWLRENAESFGGNPKNIVIWGESAGATSVSIHMLSEKSWPLFDKAIIQSGAFNSWVTREFSLSSENFEAAAERLGCSNGTFTMASITCLERQPTVALLNVSDDAYGNLTWKNNLPHPDQLDSSEWSPVIDGVNLKDRTTTLLVQGKVAPMKPLLYGSNLNDGTQFLMDGSGAPTRWNRTVFQKYVAPYLFSREVATHKDFEKLYVDSIGNSTTTSEFIYSNAWYSASYALTDYLFLSSNRRAARILTGYDKLIAPFVYLFKTTPEFSPNFPKTKWLGSFHGADVPFTWGDEWEFRNSEETFLSRAMVRMWTNFAWSGDPNSRDPINLIPDPEVEKILGGKKWEKYTNESDAHLEFQKKSLSQAIGLVGESGEIGGGIRIAKKLRHLECDFWDKFSNFLPIPK
eukprot:g1492.t1